MVGAMPEGQTGSLRMLFRAWIRAWIFGLVAMAVVATNCASSESVKNASLSYLESRYNEPFRVLSIDMGYNEGNLRTAELSLAPERNPAVNFRLNYNYRTDEVRYEDYLIALWCSQVKEKIQSLAPVSGLSGGLRINLSKKGTLVVNGRDLEVIRDYKSGIAQLGLATIRISGTSANPFTPQQALQVSSLMSRLRTDGFAKVSVSINYPNGRSLQAQSYGKHPAPSVSDLQALYARDAGSERKSSGILYEKALAQEKSDPAGALRIYESIVAKQDSPFRYGPYIVTQSCFVYESAYRAGLLLRKDDPLKANRYFDLVLDRLEFEEVLLEYYKIKKEIEGFRH